MRVAVLLLAVAVTWTTTPSHAEAPDGLGASATPTDAGVDVSASQLGDPGVPNRSSGGTVSCRYFEVGEEISESGYGGQAGLLTGFNVVTDLVEDFWYFAACAVDGALLDSVLFRYAPGDTPISAEYLAQEARDTLVLAYPDPHMSPPADFQQLVGLRTWLWLTPDGFESVSATAAIPGLSVTATATPTQVLWDMGDGSEPVVCAGPGTAYDTDLPDDQQETECSHLYQVAGSYTASAAVTWSVEWSATNGAGGTFPDVDRTTTVDLDVIERQAVVVDNP